MAVVTVTGGGAEIDHVRFSGIADALIEVTASQCRISNVFASSSNSTSPAITISGDQCELEGIVVGGNQGTSCIEITGDDAKVRNIRQSGNGISAGIRFNGSDDSILDGFEHDADGSGVIVLNSARVTITGLAISSPDTFGVLLDGADYCTVRGNIYQAGEHGLRLTNSDHNKIEMTIINSGRDTNDTYDNIRIEGASNRNMIQNCKLQGTRTGNDTRYGVNVAGSGECNIVVGNDFGDPADYGTDALGNTASNTQLFYPADATYGDNWTDCGSGS